MDDKPPEKYPHPQGLDLRFGFFRKEDPERPLRRFLDCRESLGDCIKMTSPSYIARHHLAVFGEFIEAFLAKLVRFYMGTVVSSAMIFDFLCSISPSPYSRQRCYYQSRGIIDDSLPEKPQLTQ